MMLSPRWILVFVICGLGVCSCGKEPTQESYTIRRTTKSFTTTDGDREMTTGQHTSESTEGTWDMDFHYDNRSGWRSQTRFGDGTTATSQNIGSPSQESYRTTVATPQGQKYDMEHEGRWRVDEER